jgi:superfamily II DNA or RNA helicase
MIVNVHILDEGINIDDCDSVFVAQPNDNIANLVQRMSRGNRITPNKQVCYVYLWAVQNKVDTILDYIMNNTANFCKDKVFKMNFDNPVVKVGKHVVVEPKVVKAIIKVNSNDTKPKKVSKISLNLNAKYICECCDYNTTVKQGFKKHILSN